jgi:hypothetical protein
VNSKLLLPVSWRDWLDGKNIPRDIPRSPRTWGPPWPVTSSAPPGFRGLHRVLPAAVRFRVQHSCRKEFDPREHENFSNPEGEREINARTGSGDLLGSPNNTDFSAGSRGLRSASSPPRQLFGDPHRRKYGNLRSAPVPVAADPGPECRRGGCADCSAQAELEPFHQYFCFSS